MILLLLIFILYYKLLKLRSSFFWNDVFSLYATLTVNAATFQDLKMIQQIEPFG